MIRAILQLSWISLRRDRTALGLTFALPLIFFSIFAMIFGGGISGSSNGTPDIRLAVVDRERARRLVRDGRLPVALIVSAGFGDEFGHFGGELPAVELIYDSSNPLAQGVVGGLVQAAAFSSAPDVLMKRGMEAMDAAGGFLTDDQRRIMEEIGPALRGEVPWSDTEVARNAAADEGAGFTGLVTVDAVDVHTLDPKGVAEEDEEESGNSGIA